MRERNIGRILTCGLGGEINGDGSDLIVGGIAIEFGDEKIVVLHAERELLHVCEWKKLELAFISGNFLLTYVVNRSIIATKQQKRPGMIERKNRQQILDLEMSRVRVPNADLARR